MRRKGRRLTLIGSALAVAAVALGLVLYALRDSIVFFYSPAEVAAKALGPGSRLRLGGLVEQGTVERDGGGAVTFKVTDMRKDMTVTYRGLLPDLFREGQGVVAEGVLEAPDRMRADTILAKHDERYMPRDVADKLKKQGLWREDQAALPASGASASADTPPLR
jgi:cytochrome c-type biogenesis protein CcmE